MSYFEKTQVQASDSGSIDAFGRWRVSNPSTLLDGRFGPAEAINWSNVLISGTLASTSNSSTASTTFTSTANTPGNRIRQTFKRFAYISGKSQLVLCTFVFGAGVGGNKKLVGYFDNRNGLFLQQNGSEISLNRRTYTSNATVDNKTVQADWNLDRLDGTGASGITLDFTKTQILVIDFEWLGVGRVRFGFNIDGITYYCHQLLNANTLTDVYMSTGSLPIRYQMISDGTGGSSDFKCICASVTSEGGQEPLGTPGGRTTLASLNTLASGTAYIVKGLRYAATQVYGPVVKITGADLVGTSANDFFEWYIVKDATVTGSLTWVAVPNSAVEHTSGNSSQTINISSNTLTIISCGTGFSETDLQLNPKDDFSLETTADNVPVPIYLIIRPLSTMNCIGTIRWREQ